VDLKTVAREAKGKLNPEAIRGAVQGAVQGVRGAVQGDGRAQVIGGSAVGLVVLALVLLLTLTTCGGAGGAGGAGAEDKPKKSRAVVEISPKDGADGVGTEDALKVTAEKGKLVEVDVKDEDGKRREQTNQSARWSAGGR
jgi:hypothetical protein